MPLGTDEERLPILLPLNNDTITGMLLQILGDTYNLVTRSKVYIMAEERNKRDPIA